eukprot:340384-Chlamydomonas_euryale.AAC.1
MEAAGERSWAPPPHLADVPGHDAGGDAGAGSGRASMEPAAPGEGACPTAPLAGRAGGAPGDNGTSSSDSGGCDGGGDGRRVRVSRGALSAAVAAAASNSGSSDSGSDSAAAAATDGEPGVGCCSPRSLSDAWPGGMHANGGAPLPQPFGGSGGGGGCGSVDGCGPADERHAELGSRLVSPREPDLEECPSLRTLPSYLPRAIRR